MFSFVHFTANKGRRFAHKKPFRTLPVFGNAHLIDHLVLHHHEHHESYRQSPSHHYHQRRRIVLVTSRPHSRSTASISTSRPHAQATLTGVILLLFRRNQACFFWSNNDNPNHSLATNRVVWYTIITTTTNMPRVRIARLGRQSQSTLSPLPSLDHSLSKHNNFAFGCRVTGPHA